MATPVPPVTTGTRPLKGSLYTLGYYGWTSAALQRQIADLDALLLDIRYSPLSRTSQWSKKYLQNLLGAQYVYMRTLGNQNYKNGGPIAIVDYETGKAFVEKLLTKSNVVLLCVCVNLASCHRLVVAQRLERDLALPRPTQHLRTPVRPAASPKKGGIL